MVANPERRAALLDAAVEVLGDQGARALTFRRIDAAAGVPLGTAANYLPSREALLLAVAERAFERLAPDPARVAETLAVGGREAAVAFAVDVAERLTSQPVLARALLELRLEAARTPAVRRVVEPFLREGLAADIAFHEDAGLPGGADAVRLLHHAIDGLVLDAVSTGLDPQAPRDAARVLAERIIP